MDSHVRKKQRLPPQKPETPVESEKPEESEDPEESEELGEPEEELEDSEEAAEIPLEPITILRPDIQFRVLQALQENGLFFIDLESGHYVDGLIYFPSLGLSFSPPPSKVWQPTLGFLSLDHFPTKSSVALQPGTVELDAILFFEYEGPECETGIIGEVAGLPIYLFYLTIWNDREIRHWDEILQRVISKLTLTQDGQGFPLVKFTVTSTFVPNQSMETSKLVVDFKKPCDDTDTEAISDQCLTPADDDYEDKLHRPRF